MIFAILTWGKSTERIAATTPNASGLDLISAIANGNSLTFPYVPDFHDLNDSPGTFLRHRLTPGSAGWSTTAMADGLRSVEFGVVRVRPHGRA